MTAPTESPVRAIEYESAELAPPTRVRYGVLAWLCTLALLLYIDRVCIGQAAPSIQHDLGLTKVQMSWVFNAFTLAYCLFEVPTGHWGDRHGSRGVIARVVVCWSIFTALTGAALGLWSLIVTRFLFGAGEAGAFPNAARVVTRWFPPHERGRARGSITFVSLVGAAVAPILAAQLITHVGWRATFAIFGAVGLAWAASFYAWFRDDPAKHPATNAAERALIAAKADEADDESHDANRAHSIPWSRVLMSPNTWLMGLIMGVYSILFYMQFQWYPTYLQEAQAQGASSSGWLTAAVMGGGALGCLAGGLLSDIVQRHSPTRNWSRRLLGAGALLLAALSILCVRRVDSAGAATLCSAAGMFFMQVGIPNWWSVVADISGRHGAALWGLMNSMAGFALIGATTLVGWFVQRRLDAGYSPQAAWGVVFDGIFVALMAGAAAWMIVNPTRSIVVTTEALSSQAQRGTSESNDL